MEIRLPVSDSESTESEFRIWKNKQRRSLECNIWVKMLIDNWPLEYVDAPV